MVFTQAVQELIQHQTVMVLWFKAAKGEEKQNATNVTLIFTKVFANDPSNCGLRSLFLHQVNK